MRPQAVAGGGHVGEQAVHQLPRLAGIGGHAAATVHVGGERDVAELGDLPGAPLEVVVRAPPFAEENHPGPRAGLRGIPGEIALERGAAGAVAQGLGLDLGHGFLPCNG